MANSITCRAAVVIAVRDLQSSLSLFQRAYDVQEPIVEDHPEFGATIAHFAGTAAVLAAPNSEKTWLIERIARFGECPVAFLLEPSDFSRALNEFRLQDRASWFGCEVAWFDPQRLGGTRLGLMR